MRAPSVLFPVKLALVAPPFPVPEHVWGALRAHPFPFPGHVGGALRAPLFPFPVNFGAKIEAGRGMVAGRGLLVIGILCQTKE